ncbi:SAG family member [Eimeria brunetti]|uniref:SAG family member n=1 Tax=Eimeria brunetti TaxID=51314 RepID=U6L629_9EIME|nr:SAG family member [Eimeria brunetti]
MISFYKKITAVCLVASAGFHSVAGGTTTYKWTAEDVTDDAYLSVKLARNGRLPVHINDIATDGELVTSLKKIIGNEEGSSETTCQELIESKVKREDIFYSVVSSQGEPDYRQSLQTSLEEGFKAFEPKKYPKTADEWQKIWGNKAGANLAYLLSSNSMKVGCIIGKCTAVQTGSQGGARRQAKTQPEIAVLLCDLQPAATKYQAPFDGEYFAGLVARTAKLADMTATDLKAPTNDGSAQAAIPSIVFAALAAVVTAISA